MPFVAERANLPRGVCRGYTCLMHEAPKDNAEDAAPKRRWTPQHMMFALTVPVVAVLLMAYRKDPYAAGPFLVIIFPTLIGMLGAWFQAMRYGLALGGLLIGLLIGIFSGIDFLFLPVDGAFYAVFTSLGVYVTLGLIVGGFAETVRFLHFLTHGGKPGHYHSRRPAK
jgi:hypothetical protein